MKLNCRASNVTVESQSWCKFVFGCPVSAEVKFLSTTKEGFVMFFE